MSVPSFLSAIVVAHGDPDELDGVVANLLNQDRQPEEIIVIDNDPRGGAKSAPHNSDPLVRYLCPGEDLGTARARNRGAAEARGDTLLFVPDYTRFDKYYVADMVMNGMRPPEIACLAFRVWNATSHEIIHEEYPGIKADRWDQPREVCRVSGCAYAFRRAMFMELGGYDEHLTGGEEDLELAIRVIRAGWHIRYVPALIVNLRTSMKPPTPHPVAFGLIRNHLYIALKHFPLPYVITHAAYWGMQALYLAIRHQQWPDFLEGIRVIKGEGLDRLAKIYQQENPMPKQALDYMQKHEGPVWF